MQYVIPNTTSSVNSYITRSSIMRNLLSKALPISFVLAILCGSAMAQAPTNQLHFAFADASGTTTPSDTSLNPSAIVISLNMSNALSPAVAVNLHGPVGSGVTNIGVTSISRALDFTADIIPTQTNQPANS